LDPANLDLPVPPSVLAGMLAVSLLAILMGRPLILRSGGFGKQVGVALVAIGIFASLVGLVCISSLGVAWSDVVTGRPPAYIVSREISSDILAAVGWVAVLFLGWSLAAHSDPS